MTGWSLAEVRGLSLEEFADFHNAAIELEAKTRR